MNCAIQITIRCFLVLLFAFFLLPASFGQAKKALIAPETTVNSSDNPPVFGDICLGDAHGVVKEKLRKSSLLELTVDEIYLGRFGLNGSYRTKKTIGGLKCLLYFDWDGGQLKELTMQTQPQQAGDFDASLKKNWKELIELMTTLNGKPLQAANFPQSSLLQNDMALGTHLWRLPNAGTAILGVSKSAEGYMVNVRFTSENIQPVILSK